MNLHEEIIPEKYFYLADGKVLKNVSELTDELKKMDDLVYNHHVSIIRNDFANWIRDVYLELELAEVITKAKNKKEMQKILLKVLKKKKKEYDQQKKILEKQAKKVKNELKEGVKIIETPKKRSEILRLLKV